MGQAPSSEAGYVEGDVQADTFQGVRDGLATASSIVSAASDFAETILGPYAIPIKVVLKVADVILGMFQQCAANNEAFTILKTLITEIRGSVLQLQSMPESPTYKEALEHLIKLMEDARDLLAEYQKIGEWRRYIQNYEKKFVEVTKKLSDQMDILHFTTSIAHADIQIKLQQAIQCSVASVGTKVDGVVDQVEQLRREFEERDRRQIEMLQQQQEMMRRMLASQRPAPLPAIAQTVTADFPPDARDLWHTHLNGCKEASISVLLAALADSFPQYAWSPESRAALTAIIDTDHNGKIDVGEMRKFSRPSLRGNLRAFFDDFARKHAPPPAAPAPSSNTPDANTAASKSAGSQNIWSKGGQVAPIAIPPAICIPPPPSPAALSPSALTPHGFVSPSISPPVGTPVAQSPSSKDPEAQTAAALRRFGDKKYTSLDLSNSALTDAHLQRIFAGLATAPQIAKVHMNKNRMTAVGVSHFVAACGQQARVQHLAASENPLGDEGARLFAALLRSPTCPLLVLQLNGCGLTDAGAGYLADGLRANTSLTALGLADNHITDQGARALADALAANRMLGSMSLSRNALTADGIAALRAVRSTFSLTA